MPSFFFLWCLEPQHNAFVLGRYGFPYNTAVFYATALFTTHCSVLLLNGYY